jgi:hypothetical protein
MMRMSCKNACAGPKLRFRGYAAFLLLLIAFLGVGPAPAAAQQDFDPASTPAGPGVASASSGEVRIELVRFGVGNVARRGEWTGVQVRIMDAATRQRELIVRLSGFDADGDTPLYQREVAANPGVWQGVWLYPRLHYQYEPGTSLEVRVYEAEEGEASGSAEGDSGFRAGRLLGSLMLNPTGSVRASEEGMNLVIGSRALGLNRYYIRNPNTSGDTWHLRGHELTEAVLASTPAELPDRWMGYQSFDTVVWSQGDPAELRGERARALRDWVERGGHLIIIMPPVGQTWTNKASNELHDIMPVVSVSRLENVDLAPYRPLLASKTSSRFPKTGIVHQFKPMAEAFPNEAMRILNGPDGECVVARRLVGVGAVTLIGLDINQTAFSQFDALDTDVFWHRVLGRRGRLSEEPDVKAAQDLAFTTRHALRFDTPIQDMIAKKGRSATGVLAGFFVFVAYWLVAGPIGFAALKMRKLTHHAWVAFVLSAAVFTGVSWGGATVLRPSKIEASHFTMLDHVYGQPVQRARMFASVLIPSYGTARISVGDPADASTRDAARRSLNSITAWEPPEIEGGGWTVFPDARGYVIDTRLPDSITVPTRSTVKQIQADWAGGPRWKMIRPTGPGGEGNGQLTLVEGSVDRADSTQQPGRVRGWVTHDLPGTLRDVVIFVVRRQTRVVPATPQLICVADAFSKPEWKPGEAIDLALSTVGKGAETFGVMYLDSLTPSAANALERFDSGQLRFERLFNAITFFPHLRPPEAGVPLVAALRRSTHSWDLGRWFTQPCIIITGYLGGEGDGLESPVPLAVDGALIPTTGRTLVRWVYPLPDNPPELATAGAETTPETPAEPETVDDGGT